MADHIGQRNRRSLIRQMPVRSESHGRHARGVNHAPHPALPRRFQNRPRAFNIRAIHLLRIANPEPVVGGDVKHHLATRHRFLQRSRVAQVPGHPLRLQILNIPEIAAGADQQPQIGSLLGQDAGHMAAHKSRRTGDES